MCPSAMQAKNSLKSKISKITDIYIIRTLNSLAAEIYRRQIIGWHYLMLEIIRRSKWVNWKILNWILTAVHFNFLTITTEPAFLVLRLPTYFIWVLGGYSAEFRQRTNFYKTVIFSFSLMVMPHLNLSLIGIWCFEWKNLCTDNFVYFFNRIKQFQ